MYLMYPYAKVLYKDDDTPGWNVAIIEGSNKYIEDKCKELWKTYKIFSGNRCCIPLGIRYPVILSPHDTHMICYWIYSCELKKWFLEEEPIPLPVKKCNHAHFFEIKIDSYEDDVELLKELYLDRANYHNLDVVDVDFDITIKAGRQKFSISLQYEEAVYFNIKYFLEKIKNDQYTNLIIDEFTYVKILSWPAGNDCRVIFQDYSYHDYVQEPISTVIDKNLFVEVFEKFLGQIDSQYRELDKAVRAACKESEIKKE